MEMKQVEVLIEGTSPCFMHNGQLANPFNPFTKAMKTITSKRKKTEDDLLDLMKAEFMGGLYLDANGHPAWPGENLLAMIQTGAKVTKGGRLVTQGLECGGIWPLIYDGPKTPEKLWDDKKFVDYRGVGVNQNTVMRTRPVFDAWSLRFRLEYDPDVIDSANTIKRWIEDAGRRRGLGDHPKMGRFIIKEFKEV